MKRASPLVVECPELAPPRVAHRKRQRAEGPDGFMSDKVSMVHSSSASGLSKTLSNIERNGGIDERQDFEEMWKSVKAVGLGQLEGKDKKAIQMQQLKALGGKGPAAKKTPYHILVGMKKKQKQREGKLENELRESKLVASSSHHRHLKRNRTDGAKDSYAGQDKGLRELSNFRNGVLHVPGHLTKRGGRGGSGRGGSGRGGSSRGRGGGRGASAKRPFKR